MTSILVTGGTGTLGRRVTGLLTERGHEVRVLSRHAQQYAVDLRDARDESALHTALDGVGTVVHCATSPRGGDDTAAGRLLAGASRPRRVLPVPLFGKTYAAFRAGGHLTPERAVGTATFEDFLAATRRP